MDPTAVHSCFADQVQHRTSPGGVAQSCAGIDACITRYGDRVNLTCIGTTLAHLAPHYCVGGATGPLCLHCDSRLGDGYVMTDRHTCSHCLERRWLWLETMVSCLVGTALLYYVSYSSIELGNHFLVEEASSNPAILT